MRYRNTWFAPNRVNHSIVTEECRIQRSATLSWRLFVVTDRDSNLMCKLASKGSVRQPSEDSNRRAIVKHLRPTFGFQSARAHRQQSRVRPGMSLSCLSRILATIYTDSSLAAEMRTDLQRLKRDTESGRATATSAITSKSPTERIGFLAFSGSVQAQSAIDSDTAQTGVFLAKLHDPVYPPIARTARIYGTSI